MRTRKSVWSLPAGDQTLLWYGRAIQKMLTRADSDPTSWVYLAAIHGIPGNLSPAPGTQGVWAQCWHQSWFFLPWHRCYLASFEAVVAKTVADLGGPSEWALPYWDYSEPRATNRNARLLPPAFRDQRLADGSENPLWSRRAQVVGGDFGLTDNVVSLDALKFRNFTNSNPGVPSGFGGPDSMNNPGTGNGALEEVPHNRIHVRIGGDSGFMSHPATAAFDPIFWLHHCNIDRVWEVWRNRPKVSGSPTDPRWRSTQPFRLPNAQGQLTTFHSRDALDTRRLLHGFVYANVPPAQEPAPGGPRRMGMAPRAPAPPRVAGANREAIDLGMDRTETLVALAPAPARRGLAAPARPERVFLSLENVTGTGIPGDYRVYIDLPDDEEPPTLVGHLTTFGIARASDGDGDHGGGGLFQSFDITETAARLGITQRTKDRFRVTFEHRPLAPTEDAAPSHLARFAMAPAAPSVRVGRVSLVFGSAADAPSPEPAGD